MTSATESDATIDNDYDSPWKEALEMYFPQFMQLLFPTTYADINWMIPHEFLDKELQQIVRDAESGRNYTDKLVKVFTHSGEEAWVLIHVEIQSRADKRFNSRMYRYYYRLQDRYPTRDIASLAVLTNQRSDKKIGYYERNRWGTSIQFEFPVINLQNWDNRLEQLQNDPNPFAIIILAQLIAHRTAQDDQARKANKFQLVRSLYQRGYNRQDILELFRFIDWMLQLPKKLELQLTHDIEQLEKEQQMPYITAIERFAEEKGIKEGILKGKQEGILKGKQEGIKEGKQEGIQIGEAKTLLKLLKLKFGNAPQWVDDKINSASKEQLDCWIERILTADSIDNLFA